MHDKTERYVLYYPDEGRYSIPMTLREAKKMLRMFINAEIVNIESAEVFG